MSPTSSCISFSPLLNNSLTGKQTHNRHSARALTGLHEVSKNAHAASDDQTSQSQSCRSHLSDDLCPTVTQFGMQTQQNRSTLVNDRDKVYKHEKIVDTSPDGTPVMLLNTATRNCMPRTTGRRTNSRLLRRKPSVIADFVSDQRSTGHAGDSRRKISMQVNSDGMSSSHIFAEARTSPMIEGTDLTLQAKSIAKTQLSSMNAGIDSSFMGFHSSSRSPEMFSEISVTPSLRQSISPGSVFTHATALTSRTSYSPLYAASLHTGSGVRSSPLPTRIRWSGSQSVRNMPVSGVSTPATPWRSSTVGQKTSPTQRSTSGAGTAGASTEVSGSTNLSSPMEASKQVRSQTAPRLVRATTVVTTPPELAHLLEETPRTFGNMVTSSNDAECDAAVSNKDTNPYYGCSIDHPLLINDCSAAEPKFASSNSCNRSITVTKLGLLPSLKQAETSQPSRAMPKLTESLPISAPTASTEPKKVGSPIETRTGASRPSFGFMRHRQREDLASVRDSSKGFARTKIDALCHYAGKLMPSEDIPSKTTSTTAVSNVSRNTHPGKPSFFRRALSLAHKKVNPNTNCKTPVATNPALQFSQGYRKSTVAKRTSDGERGPGGSPSKKVFTEAHFMRNASGFEQGIMGTVGNPNSKSADLPHKIVEDEKLAHYDTIACQNPFGFQNMRCNIAPSTPLDLEPGIPRIAKPLSTMNPLMMNPRTPQPNPHVAAAYVTVTTNNSDLRPVHIDKRETSLGQTKPSSFSVDALSHAKDKSHTHLERVLEDDLLSFSQRRNSMSSYASSAGTFYFPAAPTHPPLETLPPLPDYVRNLESQFRKAETSSSSAITEHPKAPSYSLLPHPTASTPVPPIESKKKEQNPAKRYNAKIIKEAKESPSIANLRFASLTTSKWLSFGRILLSNVNANDNILVIDGLGKDWSYYCASNYPTAKIYTLMLDSAIQPRSPEPSRLQPPPNHYEIPYPNPSVKFPFPEHFFNATVFRFPSVTTNAALRFAISECTRVLQPDGHMEICTIDLDLANMGNRARRTVRELKTKIHSTRPEVCLKPVSDNIQLHLGQCGFQKLSRCYIGIPAAGPVTESRSSADEKTRGFGELIKDKSAHDDQGIAKMVSKVGRWWYAQCYEQGDSRQSVWTDERLLEECEQLHTAFKLLICYAQKPVDGQSSAKTSFDS